MFVVIPNGNIIIINMKILLTGVKTKPVTSWSTYPWVCACCKIEFMNAEMLRNHAKSAHQKCFAFTCLDCKVGRKANFSSYLKHVRKHRKCLRLVLQWTNNIKTENFIY